MQFYEGQLPAGLATLPSAAKQELATLLLDSDINDNDVVQLSPEVEMLLEATISRLDQGEPTIDAADVLQNLRKDFREN